MRPVSSSGSADSSGRQYCGAAGSITCAATGASSSSSRDCPPAPDGACDGPLQVMYHLSSRDPRHGHPATTWRRTRHENDSRLSALHCGSGRNCRGADQDFGSWQARQARHATVRGCGRPRGPQLKGLTGKGTYKSTPTADGGAEDQVDGDYSLPGATKK